MEEDQRGRHLRRTFEKRLEAGKSKLARRYLEKMRERGKMGKTESVWEEEVEKNVLLKRSEVKRSREENRGEGE